MTKAADITTNPWDRPKSLNDATPREWDRAAKSAFDTQVGGYHYKEMSIQPIEFILANDLSYCEANIVKYVCRHHAKGGRQDIEKVIHYAQLLLEHIYGDDK